MLDTLETAMLKIKPWVLIGFYYFLLVALTVIIVSFPMVITWAIGFTFGLTVNYTIPLILSFVLLVFMANTIFEVIVGE